MSLQLNIILNVWPLESAGLKILSIFTISLYGTIAQHLELLPDGQDLEIYNPWSSLLYTKFVWSIPKSWEDFKTNYIFSRHDIKLYGDALAQKPIPWGLNNSQFGICRPYKRLYTQFAWFMPWSREKKFLRNNVIRLWPNKKEL